MVGERAVGSLQVERILHSRRPFPPRQRGRSRHRARPGRAAGETDRSGGTAGQYPGVTRNRHAGARRPAGSAVPDAVRQARRGVVSIRLLTYNIQRGGIGRVDHIARVINDCQPDIVLLQEASDLDDGQALASLTHMAASGSFTKQSLGYLSRQPVEATWHRPRVSRHAFIEIVTKDDETRVFGVHLSAIHSSWTERGGCTSSARCSAASNGTSARVSCPRRGLQHAGAQRALAGLPSATTSQAARMAGRRPYSMAHDSDGARCWLCGCVPASSIPTRRDWTMPTWDPHVRLDYVFVPHGFADRIIRCDVVASEEAAAASDHFPVVADLRTD